MTNENQHPAHPVRNFFYILLSLLNLAAFLCAFYALATPEMPYRTIVFGASSLWVAFALLLCFFAPLLKRRGK